MTEIILPWPPAVLSPNTRVHWAQKAKAAKRLKHDCWALAKAAGITIAHGGQIDVHLCFRFPTAGRYDMDNAIGRMKYALDGLALALGVDDSRFNLHAERGEPIRGGAVVVRIGELKQQNREAA